MYSPIVIQKYFCNYYTLLQLSHFLVHTTCWPDVNTQKAKGAPSITSSTCWKKRRPWRPLNLLKRKTLINSWKGHLSTCRLVVSVTAMITSFVTTMISPDLPNMECHQQARFNTARFLMWIPMISNTSLLSLFNSRLAMLSLLWPYLTDTTFDLLDQYSPPTPGSPAFLSQWPHSLIFNSTKKQQSCSIRSIFIIHLGLHLSPRQPTHLTTMPSIDKTVNLLTYLTRQISFNIFASYEHEPIKQQQRCWFQPWRSAYAKCRNRKISDFYTWF